MDFTETTYYRRIFKIIFYRIKKPNIQKDLFLWFCVKWYNGVKNKAAYGQRFFGRYITLLDVVSKITKYDRCLIFLDPYALELKWDTLEAISKCGVVDLWYLFPLSLVRLIEKERDIIDANKQKVSSILGTEEWFDKLFVESKQLDFLVELTLIELSILRF